MIYTGCLQKYILFINLNNNKIFKKSYITRLSVYVTVMGIIKCEKVFVGFFYFDRKQFRKIKNHSKTFFALMIPISITYIVLFNFTQII